MSFVSSWRTALRIARREARRGKGRSALVVAMIAAPVLCLSFAAVSYDMFTLTPTEQADRTMGGFDARVQWPGRFPVEQDPAGTGWSASPVAFTQQDKPPTQAELATILPPGTAIVPVRRGSVALRTVDGVGQPNAVSVDATNPLTRGYVEVLEGRAPAGAAEVALTRPAVRRLGASIGDTISTADAKHTFTVVGLVEFPSLLEEVVLFGPITGEVPAYLSVDEEWFVDTPAPIGWSAVKSLNREGILVTSRAVLLDPPSIEDTPFYNRNGTTIRELALPTLVGGLALLEIILLAGPAFAVSARRRQRQLALVAANGGTPAHIRRMVLADGVVLGTVGAAVGIALGIVAAVLGRPYVEEHFAHARAGGYRFFLVALAVIAGLAIATGVLAALVPAFITARQNVVASLAGRRGVTRSKKRWLVVGTVMVAAGTAIVVYGTQRISAEIMLVGLVLGELGLVLWTPALVGLIARVGRLLPLAPRIALRDAARNRAAAAPAISAVMAAVAGSVAVGLLFEGQLADQREHLQPSLPVGSVYVYTYAQSGPGEPVKGPDDQNAARARAEAALAKVGENATKAEAAARAIFPVASVYQITVAGCPLERADHYCGLIPQLNPAAACPWLKVVAIEQRELTAAEARQANADPRCRDAYNTGTQTLFGGPTIDDGTALRAITGASEADAAAASAVLRAGGVVVTDDRFLLNGSVTLAVLDVDPRQPPANDPELSAPRLTVPGYALTTATIGRTMIVSPGALAKTGLVARPDGVFLRTSRLLTTPESDRLTDRLNQLNLTSTYQGELQIPTDPRIWIVMIAAALITLAAAAIGTGLAAADSRGDLSTLAAVGASPRMRRGLSLSQSGVIAGLGSLLGALAGLGAAVAVIVALNQRYVEIWPGPTPLPIRVPWLSLGTALLLVPAIALAGAGLLTRSRLPIERRT